MAEESMVNTITLGGDEVPYRFCYLPQFELQYYPENPRVYSVVYTSQETPSQEEIQETLQEREHVKELLQSIQANGGLIDPLWVRDGDFVVIEGNSRLAAYRLLARKDAIKWGKVKCHLLPKDLDDKKIFSFLCQCHVIGRQDWAPYEQAGVIWRRHKFHGDSAQQMAKEMGLGVTAIKRFIDVYSFMDENNDTAVQHWSYYFEYIKSRKIEDAREEYPELDNVVVAGIKSGDIPKAEDIRDKLTKIADIGGRLLEAFIEKPKSLETCYHKATEISDDVNLYRTLNKFRIKIGDLDTKRALVNMREVRQKKCVFELKKIKQSTDKLLKVLR